MTLVLDVSVTLAWCYTDEQSEWALRILRKTSRDGAVVPRIWQFEIVNGLTVGERRRRLERSDAENFLDFLDTLPIEHDPMAPSPLRLLHLTRDTSLSAYDSLYLEVSLRRGLPLATQDRVLKKAASQVGVNVI